MQHNIRNRIAKKIKQLNEDENIDGLSFNFRYQSKLILKKILMAIDPSKDVDGFHPENFGKMALDMTTSIPAPLEF
jgi:methylenetetrahydrofolate dehydrogenase (NADP+)/methenyltetrahydrofolate cyclohydrolase